MPGPPKFKTTRAALAGGPKSKNQKISSGKIPNSFPRFKRLEPKEEAQSAQSHLSGGAGKFASGIARDLFGRAFVTDCDLSIVSTSPDQMHLVAGNYRLIPGTGWRATSWCATADMGASA